MNKIFWNRTIDYSVQVYVGHWSPLVVRQTIRNQLLNQLLVNSNKIVHDNFCLTHIADRTIVYDRDERNSNSKIARRRSGLMTPRLPSEPKTTVSVQYTVLYS